jgi:type III pantothenate kinase
MGNSGIKVTLAFTPMHNAIAANTIAANAALRSLDSNPIGSSRAASVISSDQRLDWSKAHVQRVWQATWRHADLDSAARIKSKIAFHANHERRLDVDDPAWPMQLIQEVHQAFGITDLATPAAWLVSSVQRSAWQNWSTQLAQHRPNDITQKFENCHLAWPLNVDYPERVGTDRVLAAWAAWNLLQRCAPLVVIQAGTAITVDAVDAQGVYAGGAILPGLRLTLNALAGGTDLLPHLTAADSPSELPSLPGKNTEAAMLAGGVAAVIGGIEHLLRRYQSLWSQPIPVMISGGNRAYLSPLLSYPTRVVDHLVLLGLCGFLDSNGK